MSREPRCITGLGTVLGEIDHVVLDQWGVLHRGGPVLADALQCVEQLRHTGKSVVILSNSGKRSANNVRRLAELGLPPSRYDTLLSSGELAWRELRERRAAPYDRLGRRCFLITRGGDRSVIDDLPYDLVERIEEADFILVSGADEEKPLPETWRLVLAAGAARRLPFLCANPDLVMITPRQLLPGAGALARLYEELGGTVTYIGKPHPAIYAACLELLGRPPASRVLAVGDSLDHDVLGAQRAGMRSVLLTSGVHAPEFASARTPADIVATARRLAGGADLAPDWIMPALAW